VGEPDFVGESSDEFVAAGGKFGGGALLGSGETGENQKATACQGRFPVGRQTQILQAAGRADDDGLRAAKEDAETLFFHRRMEAADHTPPGVAPMGRLIIGGEDCAARTPGGAEEGDARLREQVEIAEGGDVRRRTGTQTFAQARWITSVSDLEHDGRHGRLRVPAPLGA
jgi:hypothetical protein